MIVPALIVFLLIVGIGALMYKRSVQEFQVLQKDHDPTHPWSELLGEQLPLVIRSLPPIWLSPWTKAQTAQKTWVLTVKEHGKKFRTTWNTWVQDPQGTPEFEPLARVSKVEDTVQEWMNDGFRCWSWLPSQVQTASPGILRPDTIISVNQVRAEFVAYVSTDGAPLDLWIAHEGAIPANVASDLRGKNPWTQTTKDIPWIGEVKYIEVKLRPGNAILVPCHWWIAVRPSKTKEESMAWYWTAEFHSPVSWAVSQVKK
jgi:hypothetical protein